MHAEPPTGQLVQFSTTRHRPPQTRDHDDHPGHRTTIEVFDTTLRDGLQVEGVSATAEDKLRIAEQLDVLGVNFIEGGWPGANPKDVEFFARPAASSI